MAFLRLSNGVPRSFAESSSTTIYWQEETIGSTITSGTAHTIPASQTFDSAELEVYFAGQRLFPVTDYNYVGTVPRTQISFTFDLSAGDKIQYRIDRVP